MVCAKGDAEVQQRSPEIELLGAAYTGEELQLVMLGR